MTESTHSKTWERLPGNRSSSKSNSLNESSTASRNQPLMHRQGASLIDPPEEKERPSREQPRQRHAHVEKQGNSGTTKAVKGRRIFVDAQGQPLQICISRSVKDISNLENKIKTHGGEVTNDDKMAFICLADPGPSYSQTMYSTEWVHHCVRQEALVDHDTPAFRLKKANRNKTHFTADQDRSLRDFIESKKRSGAKLNGNSIYKEFGITHKEHSWQSWRDRAVKVLKLTDPQSVYEYSKARREEQLRKLQNRRTAIHHDPLSKEKMPGTLQNTTAEPAPKATNIGDGEDGDKSNRSATQHMSPEILHFDDIVSDKEEDQFHKKQMLALAWRRASGIGQWSRAEPVSEDNSGDDVTDRAGSSQSVEDTHPSRSRHMSHSPAKARSNGGDERHAQARRPRLSLPSMTTRLGESSSMQRQAEFVALILKKSAESSNTASRFSPKSSQNSLTQRSWRNPPQDNLSMPESFSVPLPLPTEDTDDSQPLPGTSVEFDEIELVDEDDIMIERMIQTKMLLSHPTPSNLHELDSASRSCSEDRIQEQDNDQRDSSTHHAPDSLGQMGGNGESFHGFELPTKLLSGHTSSPGRYRSTNKAATTGPSPRKYALPTRDRRSSHEAQEELTAIMDTEPIDEPMPEEEHEAEIKTAASQKAQEKEEDEEEVHRNLSLSSVDAVEIKVSASQTKRSQEAMRNSSTRTDPIEQEEEEEEHEEERLVRRRLNVNPSQASQKNKSSLEWDQTKKEPATVGRARRQDAVQEFYADGIQIKSDPEQSGEIEAATIKRMRLMHYLKNLYREEIGTLVFYELVHPLRAIDTLDACSGDLKLARTIINHGITDEIQSQFWTREDDEKVFSKIKDDEIALVKKHSLIEIVLRYQYLSKTRADAEQLPVSMEAIQAPDLQRKRPTAQASRSRATSVSTVAQGS